MTETPPGSGPRHVAIIMDGNGRWAEARGLPRIKGHQAGAEAVRATVRACREAGVSYLTLYAFSRENWSRPVEEVRGLMQLLGRFLRDREAELHENRIRLRIAGNLDDLPDNVGRELARVVEATRDYDAGTVILALSYSGRGEIVEASRRLAEKAARGDIRPADIDEAMFAGHLYLPDVPDPDLMIRTSGEMRISNFLLWQLSYTELYVTDVLWPDFREEDFNRALEAYRSRHRRFGGVR